MQLLRFLGLPIGALVIGFVLGYYSKDAPPPPPCNPVVEVAPVEVETVVAQPETQAADAEFSDREKAMSATIAELRAEAAKKPRVITRTRTVTQKVSVPQACQQYVPKVCPPCTQCFDDGDLKLLERAQQATQR